MSSTLTDRLDQFPEGWRPHPGDKTVGQVVSLDTRDGQYGAYPVVTVAADDGREVAVHAFHTVLRGELARLRPEPGERIGIAYHGRGDGSYERYRVIVERDRPAGGVDWDREAQVAAQESDGGQPPVPSDVPIDTAGLPSPPPPSAAEEEDDIPF